MNYCVFKARASEMAVIGDSKASSMHTDAQGTQHAARYGCHRCQCVRVRGDFAAIEKPKLTRPSMCACVRVYAREVYAMGIGEIVHLFVYF